MRSASSLPTAWLRPSRLDRRAWCITIYLVAALTLIVPLTLIEVPVLADYPNHLARAHIISNLKNNNILLEHFSVDFDVIPNLAMDLVVPWLAKLLPLDVAGRLFLGLSLLATLFGTAILHRALFERLSLWPLLAAFFVYHASFLAGLANFSLGVGLLMVALGLWIEARYRPPSLRLALGLLFVLVLFFCHLVALAAYGLLIAGYELSRAKDTLTRSDGRPKALVDLAIALLPFFVIALPLFLMAPITEAERGVVFGGWIWKVKALLAPLTNYHRPLDVVSAILLFGLLVIGWRSGSIDIAKRMGPGLGFLTLAFLLAPKAFLSGGVFDQRFAIILALVLVASTQPKIESDALKWGIALGLAALFALRFGGLVSSWLDHRADLDGYRTAIDRIEEGAKVLVVAPKTPSKPHAPRHLAFHSAPQLAGLTALAVIEKSALISTIYALPGQQPLRPTERAAHLTGGGPVDMPRIEDLHAALSMGPGGHEDPRLRRWWQDYDTLFVVHDEGRPAEQLARSLPLTTIIDGQLIDAYRITPR